MLQHDLGNSEIANDRLREELIKVNEELQQVKNKQAERKMDGLQASDLDKENQMKIKEHEEKLADSQVEKYELEQQIKQLEARLVVVNSRNEDLEAEVLEADNWVYRRG